MFDDTCGEDRGVRRYRRAESNEVSDLSGYGPAKGWGLQLASDLPDIVQESWRGMMLIKASSSVRSPWLRKDIFRFRSSCGVRSRTEDDVLWRVAYCIQRRHGRAQLEKAVRGVARCGEERPRDRVYRRNRQHRRARRTLRTTTAGIALSSTHGSHFWTARTRGPELSSSPRRIFRSGSTRLSSVPVAWTVTSKSPIRQSTTFAESSGITCQPEPT